MAVYDHASNLKILFFNWILHSTELSYLWGDMKWTGLMTQLTNFVHRLLCVSVIVCYALMGSKMEAAQLFCVMMVLHSVAQCLRCFIWGYRTWVDVKVSLKRMQVGSLSVG